MFMLIRLDLGNSLKEKREEQLKPIKSKCVISNWFVIKKVNAVIYLLSE